MSKPVPRSRLHITYRTRIEGEPKKAKLPMRFLVLGKLTHRNESLLSERPMHSLLPGMKLDSFMREMKVASPIEAKDLAMRLRGTMSATVTGVFKKVPERGDDEATVKLSGTGRVEGRGKDNGLGDFVGQVTIEGEHDFTLENGKIVLPQTEVKLRVRGIVEPPGDFEAGITGSIDTTVVVSLTENTAGDALDTTIDFRSGVSTEVTVDLTIPLRGIADFRPDAVAARVPEIRRLVLLRRLVLELRSYISSSPMLGVALREQLKLTQKEHDLVRGKALVAEAQATVDVARAKLEAAGDDEAAKAAAQAELTQAQADREERLKLLDKVLAEHGEPRFAHPLRLARDEAKKALDEAAADADTAALQATLDEAEAALGQALASAHEPDPAVTAAKSKRDEAAKAVADAGADATDEQNAALAEAEAELSAAIAAERFSDRTALAQLKSELTTLHPQLLIEQPSSPPPA